jgi:hypothetical protein
MTSVAPTVAIRYETEPQPVVVLTSRAVQGMTVLLAATTAVWTLTNAPLPVRRHVRVGSVAVMY